MLGRWWWEGTMRDTKNENELPICYECDVAVVGGGVAGIVAVMSGKREVSVVKLQSILREKGQKLHIEELDEILNDPNSTESDIIIASFEKADKEDELGIAVYYTTEEVLEHIFGKAKVV